MPTIMIAVIIAIYTGYVIRKKVVDMKQGKFCSCSCHGCPSKACHTDEVLKTTKEN